MSGRVLGRCMVRVSVFNLKRCQCQGRIRNVNGKHAPPIRNQTKPIIAPRFELARRSGPCLGEDPNSSLASSTTVRAG